MSNPIAFACDVTTETRFTRRYHIGREIVDHLGIEVSDGDKVEIFVQVPGGGDWSHTNLEIGVDADLTVVVTSNKTRTREVTEQEMLEMLDEAEYGPDLRQKT